MMPEYANINSFHFRIKNKYSIIMKCLFCDFLQIVHTQSRMLHVSRSEYLLTLSDETDVRCLSDVRCQSIFMCKHCLALLTLFPTNMNIRRSSLNFRVAKCKSLEYSNQTSNYTERNF